MAHVIADENSPEERGPTGDSARAPEESVKPEVGLSASISDRAMLPWESQVTQYEPSGPPGTSYFRGQLTERLHVDCLLYRDESGDLVGILNHYPVDVPPFQSAHDINIWVRPDRRRRGIASTLLLEAFFRWGPFPPGGEPRLTQSGVDFVSGLTRMYGGSELDFSAVGWEAWHERREHERAAPDSDWRSPSWEVWHKRAETVDGREGSASHSQERHEGPGGTAE